MKISTTYKARFLTYIILLMTFLSINAQNSFKLGSYQNPIYDYIPVSTINENQLYVNAQVGDSIVWQIKDNVIFRRSNDSDMSHDFTISNSFGKIYNSVGNVLTAETDIGGFILIKNNGEWKTSSFSFQGLKNKNYPTDTLVGPKMSNATYTWFRNNIKLNNSDSYLSIKSLQDNKGLFRLMIKTATNTFNYEFYIPEGKSMETAIYDETIQLNQFNNYFTLNFSPSISDKIVWKFGIQEEINVTSFTAKGDGGGSLFIFQNGLWKTTSFGFNGIQINLYKTYLFTTINSDENTVYKWYKDGKLVQSDKSNRLTITGDGNYFLLADGGYYYFTVYQLGEYNNPIEVKDLFVQNQNRFSISPKYLDPQDWVYINNTGLLQFNYNSVLEANEDLIIQSIARYNGKYYKQRINFKGIKYDSTITGKLLAIDIPNATYSWYLNGVLLPHIKTSSFLPETIGNYKVEIVWSDNNVNTRTVSNNFASFVYDVKTLPIPSGIINNVYNTSVELYPNPTTGITRISNYNGLFEYKIEDFKGSEISKGTGEGNTDIQLDNLKTGVYLVYIKTNTGQITRKLIVY